MALPTVECVQYLVWGYLLGCNINVPNYKMYDQRLFEILGRKEKINNNNRNTNKNNRFPPTEGTLITIGFSYRRNRNNIRNLRNIAASSDAGSSAKMAKYYKNVHYRRSRVGQQEGKTTSCRANYNRLNGDLNS